VSHRNLSATSLLKTPAVILTRNSISGLRLQLFTGLLLSFGFAPWNLLSSTALANSGSGFYVSSDGHIVTNAHVVRNSKTILVYSPKTGKRKEARVLKSDESNDLALIKIDGERTHGLQIKSSLDLEKGAEVYTLGFPNPTLQGLEPKYTEGSISSFSGLGGVPNLFQISVPIQPGNSGGPLLDRRGYVVGVVVSKLNPLFVLSRDSYIPENVNFAIKADYVIPLLQLVPRSSRPTPKRPAGMTVEEVEKSVVLILAMEGSAPRQQAHNQPRRKSESINGDKISGQAVDRIEPNAEGISVLRDLPSLDLFKPPASSDHDFAASRPEIRLPRGCTLRGVYRGGEEVTLWSARLQLVILWNTCPDKRHFFHLCNGAERCSVRYFDER